MKQKLHTILAVISVLASLLIYVAFMVVWVIYNDLGNAYPNIFEAIIALGITIPLYILYNHRVVYRLMHKKHIIFVEFLLLLTYITFILSYSIAIYEPLEAIIEWYWGRLIALI